MATTIRVAICGPLQFLQEALVHVLQQRYKMQAAHFVLSHDGMSDTANQFMQDVKQFAPDVLVFFPETKEPSKSLSLIESLTALETKVILGYRVPSSKSSRVNYGLIEH